MTTLGYLLVIFLGLLLTGAVSVFSFGLYRLLLAVDAYLAVGTALFTWAVGMLTLVLGITQLIVWADARSAQWYQDEVKVAPPPTKRKAGPRT